MPFLRNPSIRCASRLLSAFFVLCVGCADDSEKDGVGTTQPSDPSSSFTSAGDASVEAGSNGLSVDQADFSTPPPPEEAKKLGCGQIDICNNGLDDDCDGQVDEDCLCIVGSVQPCFQGAPIRAGVGACVLGKQTCTSAGEFGSWAACIGSGRPQPLDCTRSGTDFNCDGVPDLGCNCVPGDSRSCYDGPLGTAGLGPCRAGLQTCLTTATGADWSPCTGQVLPQIEQCDGVDYDCDGAANTGCGCTIGETRQCYSGPEGTSGIGPCRSGTQVCNPTAAGTSSWSPCSGEVLPQVEKCDGSDYDCDGIPNTGCACTVGATRACYDGPSGTSGLGVCHGGTQTCASTGPGSSSWGACVGQVVPSVEQCDGNDYDCDGVPNTGCGCTVGDKRPCYDGPSTTAGVGPCHPGSQVCSFLGPGVSSWGACKDQALPSAELCDGTDHDCDGVPNTGCVCTVGESRACYEGPASARGVGLCRAGTQKCIATQGVAAWGPCAGQILPSTETCDGLDHDCDGILNTGCVCTVGTSEPCYDGVAATRRVGACHDGTHACVPLATGGVHWDVCAGEQLPGTEVCGNAIDDDCDGTVDEGCGTVQCPADSTVNAGSAVSLVATATSPVLQWSWTVVSGPTGGASTVVWSPNPANAATESFTPIIVGDYLVQASATLSGSSIVRTCTTAVHAVAHGLRVELTWDGSGDVDLHLHDANHTAWFNSDDCYYSLRSASWGAGLDTDNTRANGPENIRIDAPAINSDYTIGVHNYSSAAGRTATVKVYCASDGTTPNATFTSHPLAGSSSGNCTSNEFWKVALVRFSSATACTVMPINTYGASNDACSAY